MKFKQLIFSSIFWRGLYFITVLFLNIIVSRYFQAKGSGWIFYITNYFSFILLIGSLNLETGMTFYASKKMIAENKLALFSFLWSVIVALLIAGGFLITGQAPENELSSSQFVFFAFIYVAGILLTTFFCALFYAQKDFFLPNIILAATNFLLILVATADIYFANGRHIMHHFLNLYFLNFLVQGILLFVSYSAKNKLFVSWMLPRVADIKMLFRYSIFALFTNIIFFLLYRIDYWFIKNTCVTCIEGDLGNYIQVAKLGQLFLLLPSFIASVVFPHTAAGFRTEVNSWLPVLVKTVLYIDILALLFLVVTGQWLFPWVFGSTFNHMYFSFLLLMPGIIALSTIAIMASYNAGKDMVATNMKGAVIGLFIIIIGDRILIPQFGIEAAAAISSAGYAGYLGFLMYIFKKEYNASMRLFFIPDSGDLKRLRQIFLSGENLK